MKYLAKLLFLFLCLILIFSVAGCAIGPKDTSAPSTPDDVWRATPCSDNTPLFIWSDATDGDSGVDYYLVIIDGGDWDSVGNITNYTLNTALADGRHTFAVKAVDNAGNEGAAHSISFTCDATDTTPPSISSVTASITSSSSATISWTTDEPSISQVDYGTINGYGLCKPSSLLYQSTYPRNHSIELVGLNAGIVYHYRVRALDLCGNETVSDDYTFAI